MSIYTNPPEWEGAGKKPPSSKRTEGWRPGDKVPASWLNWFWFTTVNSLREIAQAFVDHRDASAPHDGHETKDGATAKVEAHSAKTTGVHGVDAGFHVAKTARADQRVGWDDVVDKPAAFPAAAHNHDDLYYSKEEIDEKIRVGFVRGLIVMWSGNIDDVPAGWALCDGRNGTPDLRDRFIVGAGRDYSVGSTGGANSVTLNINQMPSHDHGSGSLSASTAGSHSHSYHRPAFATSVEVGDVSGPYTGTFVEDTGSAGSHSHIITGTTSSRGGGQAHENRPPYYALCFIMKL